MRVLITGGAGFAGSNLAALLVEARGWPVTALDNLHRRGSDLALSRLVPTAPTISRPCHPDLVERLSAPQIAANILQPRRRRLSLTQWSRGPVDG
jgi:nucleoside-diphosphate-sugar epimerase